MFGYSLILFFNEQFENFASVLIIYLLILLLFVETRIRRFRSCPCQIELHLDVGFWLLLGLSPSFRLNTFSI